MEECFQYGGCKVKMPLEEDKIIDFKAYHKQLKAPFVIYPDWESIIKEDETHEIPGYNITVVSEYEKTQSFSDRGENAGESFMEKMEELSKELYNKIDNANEEMFYSDEDEEKFKTATNCHICDEPLTLSLIHI